MISNTDGKLVKGDNTMYVLTSRPSYLSIRECAQVVFFSVGCKDVDRYPETSDESMQQPIIQEWFDQWCGEASVVLNLHPDDDRQELWDIFCSEVASSD